MRCALSHPQAAWVTSNPTGRSESSPILNLGHMVALASGKLLPLSTIRQPTEGEKQPTRPPTHQEAPCVPAHIALWWVQAPHRSVLCPGWREFATSVATSCSVKPCPNAALFSSPYLCFYRLLCFFCLFCKVTFASDDSDSLVTIQFSWWSSFPLAQ